MFKTLKAPGAMAVTLAAAGILMVTMGTRQSLGLFVGPLNTSTGLGIVSISFALAVGQFAWGAIQPLAGAAADRWGPRPVLIAGVLVLALGSAITPLIALHPSRARIALICARSARSSRWRKSRCQSAKL